MTPYIPIERQCFFSRCRRRGEYPAVHQGKEVVVCLKHYNSHFKISKEQRT